MKSYYKLMEEELEEITKEWSIDLLIPANPAEIFDIDNPKAVKDTLGPSKTKNTDEVQDLRSASVKTSSMSPVPGGDGEEIDGIEAKQRRGEVTPPIKEEDPSKKSKVSPPQTFLLEEIKSNDDQIADYPHPR
jgi:hypothetical protein